MGELESIRVFLAIVEQQSFAGAARQLGLTPASVTRTIAALEDRLGVQLLVRTTRQVSLTSAGAVCAAACTLARSAARMMKRMEFLPFSVGTLARRPLLSTAVVFPIRLRYRRGPRAEGVGLPPVHCWTTAGGA